MASGVRDIPRFDRERQSKRLLQKAEATTREALKLGFGGTPSFAIVGPKTHGRAPLGTAASVATLSKAIKKAGG